MVQIFEVENIKCGGCMNSIRKALEQTPGVNAARPDNQAGIVEVDFDEAVLSPERISSALSDLGYPPAGDHSLGKKARSYVSCLVGRMSTPN
jgi:copper chaperone